MPPVSLRRAGPEPMALRGERARQQEGHQAKGQAEWDSPAARLQAQDLQARVQPRWVPEPLWAGAPVRRRAAGQVQLSDFQKVQTWRQVQSFGEFRPARTRRLVRQAELRVSRPAAAPGAVTPVPEVQPQLGELQLAEAQQVAGRPYLRLAEQLALRLVAGQPRVERLRAGRQCAAVSVVGAQQAQGPVRAMPTARQRGEPHSGAQPVEARVL